MPNTSELTQLWSYCEKFFREQEISCPETIAQTDSVIENAYDFIEGVGDIIGYYDEETDQCEKKA